MMKIFSISEEMCDIEKARMCLNEMFNKVAMTTASSEEVDQRELCR